MSAIAATCVDYEVVEGVAYSLIWVDGKALWRARFINGLTIDRPFEFYDDLQSFIGGIMSSFVSVLVAPEEHKAFKVPEPVSTYIKQLEQYIKNPAESKLLEIYPNLNVSTKGPKINYADGEYD